LSIDDFMDLARISYGTQIQIQERQRFRCLVSKAGSFAPIVMDVPNFTRLCAQYRGDKEQTSMHYNWKEDRFRLLI
jgi:hypothetical protein